jgi:hypothetical protein
MTKISQLTDIGASLAANDELLIRDVSDASTPNKKVTASGLFNVATALGFTGLDTIVAGVANEAKVQVYASGISGRTDTTLSGVVVARTTISGYFENASGVVSGVLFPVVTQTDIGTAPNQVPVCGMLGDMAFQSSAGVNIDTASVTQFSNVPLLTGGGIKFPPTQVASADANTLDDYEEGTFTPTVIGSTTAGTASYTSQAARYTKCGRLVHFELYLFWASGTGTGDLVITGLPFTCNSASVFPAVTVAGQQNIASSAGTYLNAYVSNGTTNILILQNPTGGGARAGVAYDVAGELILAGVYSV